MLYIPYYNKCSIRKGQSSNWSLFWSVFSPYIKQISIIFILIDHNSQIITFQYKSVKSFITFCSLSCRSIEYCTELFLNYDFYHALYSCLHFVRIKYFLTLTYFQSKLYNRNCCPKISTSKLINFHSKQFPFPVVWSVYLWCTAGPGFTIGPPTSSTTSSPSSSPSTSSLSGPVTSIRLVLLTFNPTIYNSTFRYPLMKLNIYICLMEHFQVSWLATGIL